MRNERLGYSVVLSCKEDHINSFDFKSTLGKWQQTRLQTIRVKVPHSSYVPCPVPSFLPGITGLFQMYNFIGLWYFLLPETHSLFVSTSDRLVRR